MHRNQLGASNTERKKHFRLGDLKAEPTFLKKENDGVILGGAKREQSLFYIVISSAYYLRCKTTRRVKDENGSDLSHPSPEQLPRRALAKIDMWKAERQTSSFHLCTAGIYL